MDKQILQAAMQFMMRVDLKGNEVPAFNSVMNAMQDELNSEPEEIKDGPNA